MKHFNREYYLRDLKPKNWHAVCRSTDPNALWKICKENLSTIDKYAPLRSRRVKRRKSPWITKELRQKIRHRDSLKRKANLSNDPQIWQQYKKSRNEINNKIKEVKRNYFTSNLDLHKGDMKKTWQLINELTSKNTCKTNRVSELKFNNQERTEPMSIAEAFNNNFSGVGDNLAATIPPPDHDPSFYLKATDK